MQALGGNHVIHITIWCENSFCMFILHKSNTKSSLQWREEESLAQKDDKCGNSAPTIIKIFHLKVLAAERKLLGSNSSIGNQRGSGKKLSSGRKIDEEGMFAAEGLLKRFHRKTSHSKHQPR